MNNYVASQKLWKVVKVRDDYYYEIKLCGVVIDRIKVESPSLEYMKKEGLL